jgi:hypothetical protein
VDQNHIVGSESRAHAHPVKLRECSAAVEDDGADVLGVWEAEEPRRDDLRVPPVLPDLVRHHGKASFAVMLSRVRVAVEVGGESRPAVCHRHRVVEILDREN